MNIIRNNKIMSEILDIEATEDDVYLNTHGYHQFSDFLGGISALFNDNLQRYFVPESIVCSEDLEELIDVLLRGGFSFCVEERKYV